MTQARAIIFDAPRTLSVQARELKPVEAADLEVEVSASGIGTGTEQLPWGGTMPPFPGLGYRLVPAARWCWPGCTSRTWASPSRRPSCAKPRCASPRNGRSTTC